MNYPSPGERSLIILDSFISSATSDSTSPCGLRPRDGKDMKLSRIVFAESCRQHLSDVTEHGLATNDQHATEDAAKEGKVFAAVVV